MRNLFFVVVLALSMRVAPAAQDRPGTLLVLNKDDATLAAVDPLTGRILGTVATGEGPHEVAVSADGRWAFAANYGTQTPGSSISMIDLSTMKESRRIDVSRCGGRTGCRFTTGSSISRQKRTVSWPATIRTRTGLIG